MTPCTCEDTQNFYSTKNKPWDFPGGPHLAMLGTHILSLVGELRSHMLWSNKAHVPQLESLRAAMKDPT